MNTKQDIPDLSRFRNNVYNVDVSDISFFANYPFDACTIEVSGNYESTILALLAAIEVLSGEHIGFLKYDYQETENELKIRYQIFGSELLIDTRSNDFSIPTTIVKDINDVLATQQFAKRIKEFEPMPPDDNIILTYVDQDAYNRYGLAGYGTWSEYNWDGGEKEWKGIW
jgi:hypothetical protein